MRLILRAFCAVLLAWPMVSAAHAPGASGTLRDWPVWTTQILFAAAWLAFTAGALRRPPTAGRRAAFHGGMLVLGLALFGPLDLLAERSTAWHMAQHMLLMAVVPPLLVVARPLAQWRAACGHGLDVAWRLSMTLARRPLACAAVHALAVWAWHAPGPYKAALADPLWHALEHASFLFTAWMLWWSVLAGGRRQWPQALTALLVTMAHTGMLGALLAFSPRPLYGAEAAGLADQQLAGLLMWIPGGAIYLLAALRIGARHLDGPVSGVPARAPERR
ncbi:cytochrome c oxidase assembly protein [Ramlibacter sp.]|uniref:cytochrome c oxidase assembly protein n=1 Tax=Ramlibacter sp. TaxID=1917967 RepID=UPI003D0A9D33